MAAAEPFAHMAQPAQLQQALETTGYLADEGTATAAWLARETERPLFLEGEAGVGKTSLAQALAQIMDRPLIRLQCYEGIDASQALYDWDYPRQLLQLRLAETQGVESALEAGQSLWSREFLLTRPLLAALEEPSVLLIDEVDRADDEFEAFLLEILSEYRVSIPEYGVIEAKEPPLVILTSNRTREVHDALKRRCFYHWVEHPELDREVAIVRSRVPEASQRLAEQVAHAVARMRQADLLKPPGVAESLDWARALVALGAAEVDVNVAARSLGAVLKYREDQERIATRLTELLTSDADF